MALRFETVDGELGDRLDKMYQRKGSFLRVYPGPCLMPPQYTLYATRIRDMEIREDDVWVLSYPRTGSHWIQEMVQCIGNNFDYKRLETIIYLRNPLLESSALMVTGDHIEVFSKVGNSVKIVENIQSPRFIKSHLPRDLLPSQMHVRKPKIIYIARNPKDTCVSFYYYCKLLHNIEGSFEEFADLFLQDMVPIGSFWSHVLEYWKHRTDDNVLFLTYEEMKKDQANVIRKTAKFLNKTINEAQVAGLCNHLEFRKMAKNPAVNMEHLVGQQEKNSDAKFIRKGKVGGWREYMNDELSKRFDDWTAANTKETDLEFEFE